MKHLFRHAYFAVAVAAWLCAGQTFGQITINEIVEDEQDFDSTNDLADTREFVELYNAGASSVNIENWTIGTVQLGTGLPYASFTLPAGASVTVHSGKGTNSTGHLYAGWGHTWNNTGDTARLASTSGTVIDTFTYTATSTGTVTR